MQPTEGLARGARWLEAAPETTPAVWAAPKRLLAGGCASVKRCPGAEVAETEAWAVAMLVAAAAERPVVMVTGEAGGAREGVDVHVLVGRW